MARPVIVYDAAGGSDTLASGAGPGTALTGTNAVPTGQVVALDGSPDLSSVPTDGTALLYFTSTDSVSNRRLFRITAVDDGAKTVTVVGTIVGTGVAWAIGGKRKTIENSARDDWRDAEAGWVFEYEDTGTYAVSISIDTGAIGDNTNGGVTFRAAAGVSSRPIFDAQTAINVFNMSGSATAVQSIIGLKLTCSAAAGTNSGVDCTTGSTVYIKDVEIDGTGLRDCVLAVNVNHVVIDNCDLHSATRDGVAIGGSSRPQLQIRGCAIHDNAGDGIRVADVAESVVQFIIDNYIYDNGGSGIVFTVVSTDVNSAVHIKANTINGNAADGITANSATPHAGHVFTLRQNSITNNGGYGFNASTQQAFHAAENDWNNYFGNTSGARNNLAAGANDLAVDPEYESVVDGAENFALKSTSGLIDVVTQRTA